MNSADSRQRVGIVGLGLMGGSIARSLKRVDPATLITGFTEDSKDSRAAVEAGVVDVVARDSIDAVRDQDVVIYAAPLRATLELMAEHAGSWGDASVTDVAGLKEPLLDQAREGGFSHAYVGTHPMVGGTGSGFGASVGDLFVDGTVWVVTGNAEERRVDRVEGLWQSLGARTQRIEADAHDKLIAWASHVPQLVATALAKVLAEQGIEVAHLGPGGLDMTRLALSSSAMWRDLLEVSSDRDGMALETVEQALSVLRDALRERDVDAVGGMMDQARTWRQGE